MKTNNFLDVNCFSMLLVAASASASLFARPFTPPPLVDLSNTVAVRDTVLFQEQFANWLVPGCVMLGRYPGSDPKRSVSEDAQRERVQGLRAAGVTTFVCLQQELLPLDDPKADPEPGPSFRSYYRDAGGGDARYVHFPITDMSPASSLEALDRLVTELVGRIHAGEVLYVHCWGGAGRTGLVASCLLGALYPSMASDEALGRVQAYYTARGEPGHSPETEGQVQQVRDWFSGWRARGHQRRRKRHRNDSESEL